jgi:hypothetical protein
MDKIIDREKLFRRSESAIIILLACVPLLASFPYRINIFISWEGAYRISQGQLPFRDFGTPLGGMYWVIPALFFKLFGPQMITLIKAQVFINILSGLAFRSILRSCGIAPGVRLISVLLFCVSFSFFNFWPWYNHSVIVYELMGLAALFRSFSAVTVRRRVLWILAAALFICFSFLTKQDGGGMGMMIGGVLLAYQCMTEKKWWPLPLFGAACVGWFFLIAAPFLSHHFGYWFNHGQPPHTARISLMDILNEFLGGSQWIKFYLLVILLLEMGRYRDWKGWWMQRSEMLLLLLTIGILGEAAIFQVTSYVPPDNNIFFHSFAIAYILQSLGRYGLFSSLRVRSVVPVALLVLVWWSGVFWKYLEPVIERIVPPNTSTVSKTGENVVNKRTYSMNPEKKAVAAVPWKYSSLPVFAKMSMPGPTVDGIDRLMKMDLIRQNGDGKASGKLKLLNMTELTPLAAAIPYELERSDEYPLWYHLGVCMFNKQAVLFEGRIAQKDYDLVLFEYIPSLNNFFPFRIRDSLQAHYRLADSFMAPRRDDDGSVIEVYVK